jgi:ADP-heptose:LPS heptosyltransferase
MMRRRTPGRVLIVAAALAGALTRPLRHRPQRIARILIAQDNRLGDMLMLTPLLAKLRERFPASDITMTIPPAAVGLYAGRPYGVRALPYDRWDPGTVWRLLWEPAADLALVPGDNRHAWLARAMGARRVVAFARDTPSWRDVVVDATVPYPGTPATWGDIVARLVPGDEPAPYRPEQWPAPACTPFDLPPHPYAVLHVGASSPLKLWPAERWRRLAERLRDHGLAVAWSGGTGEQHLVAEADPEGMFPSYAGRLQLAQTWHLLARARIVVTLDTSVAHLGRLTGAPTVTLFGPGSPVLFGTGRFWRDSPWLAVADDAIACRDQPLIFGRTLPWVRTCRRTPRQCDRARCMEAIGVETVWRAVTTLRPELG